MPILDWDDPATWDNAYELKDPNTGLMVHYTRAIRGRTPSGGMNIPGRAQGYIDALGLAAGSKVLFDGGGFGWSAEALKDLLPGIVVTVNDPGGYIQDATRKAAEAVEPISNTRISNNGQRNALAVVDARAMDWIITEEVLPILSDVEVRDYLSDLTSLVSAYSVRGPRIAHYVTPDGHGEDLPGFNWKFMSEWRAFLDVAGHTDDVLIRAGTYEVF